MKTIVVIVMTVSDGGTDHFVAKEDHDRFPEVPPAAFDRLTRSHSSRQSPEDPQRQTKCNQLQDHELGQFVITGKEIQEIRDMDVDSER